MYQVENSAAVLKGGLVRGRRWPRVSRTVVLLGLVSLFTDISAEMVATILPLYLVFNLGLSPLQFGVVDGIYQGAAALVRVAGGFVGDRWRRHKEVAAIGYGLSAICKLAFLAVGSAWAALTWIVFIDRTGKGIRTAPRDALISLSTPLADVVGRGRVFLGGYALLLLAYASLLLPTVGMGQLFVYLALFGAFYAATDGVLMALASSIVPDQLRGSGLAFLVTATSLARLLSSVVFGALWTAFGTDVAIAAFGLMLVLTIPLGVAALARTTRRV